jgi:hypothetical protein
LTIANKRRQSGKVETHSDLDIAGEGTEVLEMSVGIVRRERNQE